MIRLTRVRLCVILMALATLCLSAVSASAKEKEIDVKDLPQAVVDAAERTVPGGVIVEAEVETEKGRQIYEVEVEKDGKTTEIEIDESGKVLEIEAGDDDDDDDDD